MTIYRGIPGNMDWIVMVTHPGEEPKRLDPRHELANHSPVSELQSAVRSELEFEVQFHHPQ